jgi:broad specificity phosphatase PhoE
MNYYIFRHGETYETKNALSYGHRVENAEILEEGIPVIKKIAEYLKGLKTDVNYVSNYKRCLQTAEIVSEITRKAFLIDERIGEYREEKESFEEFSRRVGDFLKHINNQGLESTAICTHGGVMSALKYKVQRRKYSINKLMNFPRPGVLMIIKNGDLEQIDFN